jgi:hypothetical protein
MTHDITACPCTCLPTYLVACLPARPPAYLPACSQLSQHLLLNEDGQQFPLVSFEEFWLLRDKLVPMNDTVEGVTLQLAVKPQALWWWQIQQQMEQSFQMQINMGIAQDGESDEVGGWVTGDVD